MLSVHMMVGIQGSGKSTYSRKLSKETGMPIISSDQIRADNPGIEEKQVWPTLYDSMINHLKNGQSVIFDATNITPGARGNFFAHMKEACLDVYSIAYVFPVDRELSRARVEERNKDKNELYLPLEVIDSYVERFVEPTLDEGFSEIKKVSSSIE